MVLHIARVASPTRPQPRRLSSIYHASCDSLLVSSPGLHSRVSGLEETTARITSKPTKPRSPDSFHDSVGENKENVPLVGILPQPVQSPVSDDHKAEDIQQSIIADISSVLPWIPELSIIQEEKTLDLTARLLGNSYYRSPRSNVDACMVKDMGYHPSLASLPEDDDISSVSGGFPNFAMDSLRSDEVTSPVTSDSSGSVKSSGHLATPRTPYHSRESDISTDLDTTLEHPAQQCPPIQTSPEHELVAAEADSTTEDPEGNQCDISTASDPDTVAILKLLDCEESFVKQMQDGIQRFSWPLRHHILTPRQHRILFQNVEKVRFLILIPGICLICISTMFQYLLHH